jgi:uncharacterized membrane protein YtjA (UPF0391 family)
MPDCGDWKGWHVQVRGLIVSLIAGAFGLTNVSQVAKRVSMVLFAMFFLVFLALMGFAYLASEAIDRPARAPAATAFA